MNNPLQIHTAALTRLLDEMRPLAVAVSGGVDSLTLATVARRQLGDAAEMFHAISPAVPAEASERVRAQAERDGWRLHVLDAGEFTRNEYMQNPVNRCFFCKTSLYGAISSHTDAQMVSGANLDDLGEYRPGLEAARNHAVRHPYVEAKIDKTSVRAIARQYGLDTVAELPASPCLSSRIETGIAIRADTLELVHQTERFIAERLNPDTVRCRIRAEGVVIELDASSLAALTPLRAKTLARVVTGLFGNGGFDHEVSFAPYQVGSAFLHDKP